MLKDRMKSPRKNRQAKARPRYVEPVRRNEPGRIEMLKRKLEAVQEGIQAATRVGDLTMKGRLDFEAADLQATIFRAESLVAR